MKTLLTTVLIVAATNVSAAGFSPWNEFTEARDAKPQIAVQVGNTGFGPWRDRVVADEIDIRPQTDAVYSARELNVFRPWS